MNRRILLMERIERNLYRSNDPVIQHILSDTKRILEWDEMEITDLISRCDLLERGMNGIHPYFRDIDDYDRYVPPTV